jgi:hypothetical protein
MKCEGWIIDWLPGWGAYVPTVFVGMFATPRNAIMCSGVQAEGLLPLQSSLVLDRAAPGRRFSVPSVPLKP